MIKELSICGYRGFGKEQSIRFSLPNGKLGSGLTFIVGSNNSGKTTILESLKFFNLDKSDSPSIAERKRNIRSGSNVRIQLTDSKNIKHSIASHESGGSVTKMLTNNKAIPLKELKIFVLQSRRFVNFEFRQQRRDRDRYMEHQLRIVQNRTYELYGFESRIFNMYDNKAHFDPLLKEILGQNLNWTIEQNDNSTYYLKLDINGCIHSIEGLGDGVWSAFTICDALFDSKKRSVIAIDEPELSLHPAYQRRTMNLLKKYARDRQIIIATHSPYFLDWESIQNGAELVRTVKNSEGDIEIHALSDSNRKVIEVFSKDYHQPHTLGLEAKEVFFLEDNIILVEGQEDVVFLPLIAEQLNLKFEGDFFGWGVGGAQKMEFLIKILIDLGYKDVKILLDGDQNNYCEELKGNYPNYKFFVIPADDIRDKARRAETQSKIGIVDSDGLLKPEYRKDMIRLIREINDHHPSYDRN
ncbi:MAG: ATP-binding protein [Saccharofermentanales bacterium]